MLYEVKFTSFLPTNRSLYTVQLLHCLKGISGIPKFAGVVVDSKGQQLKSYLKEMPGKGWMFDLLSNGLKQRQPLPWCRRERWAKEIIEAVKQVHSRGFVVGTLGDVNDLPVVIDSPDRATLWNFHNKLWVRDSQDGYLPPEYRQPAPIFPKFSAQQLVEETAPATPRSDIFHLGMVLWLLAENQSPLAPSTSVKRQDAEYQLACLVTESMPIL